MTVLTVVELPEAEGLRAIVMFVGVDGPTASSARIGLSATKTGAVHDPVLSALAIDTSKAVFTLHCVDQQDRPVLRINLRRAQMIPFFKKLAATEIAMEACGGSHHWARELIALGHTVRLIPPQYVKPYVKRGKNDRNDAEAICEAAGRPGMHFVPVKSVDATGSGDGVEGARDAGRSAHPAGQHATWPCRRIRRDRRQGDPPDCAPADAIEAETAIPPRPERCWPLCWASRSSISTPGSSELDVKLTAMHKANAVSQRAGHHPGRRSDHRADVGDRDRSGGVRIRPSPGGLARADAEGTFDRRQAAHGRHQPGRQ